MARSNHFDVKSPTRPCAEASCHCATKRACSPFLVNLMGPSVKYVIAGAKISIVPVEKSATLGGRQLGLILETEEGRMCSGGATWKRLLI